jgi:cytosine deaminase
MDHTPAGDDVLLIRRGRLLDGSVMDVAIADGRYLAVGTDITAATAGLPDGASVVEIEAAGGLLTPSFVNGHLHLDKVFTLRAAGDAALQAYTSGAMSGALDSIALASAVKAGYRVETAQPLIRRALLDAVRYGCLHLQAFVDLDAAAGMRGFQAVQPIRAEFADVLDLQVVAFPQDGLVRDAGARELCEAALEQGADVVGGIPWSEYTDSDARAHVEWACELAGRTGRRVAMLTDDAGDPSLRTTGMLAEAMIRHGLVGRGVACHARAVGSYPGPTLQRLIGLPGRAGLGFVTDPHTGPLHLPVREFLDAGLPVALGQDDIEDAYYPFGRNNMLEVAFLAAHVLGFLSDADQLRLIEMITGRAAEVLGMADHAIRAGAPANLLVHGHHRVVDLLRYHDAPRMAIARGRIVARDGEVDQAVAPQVSQ